MPEVPLIIMPDDEVAGAAEVLVEGALDGRPYTFLLDTGAARTSVLRDDYTAMFESIATKHSSGVFAHSSDDLIVLPDLELGPIQRRDITVARSAERGADARPLIGMDLLRDYRLHFRFDERRVLVDAADDADDGYAAQALVLDQGSHPYVAVALGGATASAVWDTGAGLTLVDTAFLRAHAALFEELGSSQGTDATGASMEAQLYTMSAPTIGGVRFPPHIVAGVDLSFVNATIELPMDLILGYTTLRHAHWLFDFPRKRWAITRAPAAE